MDRSEIKHGDKFFLYGQFMQYADYLDSYDYNTVMGMMTVGGYEVIPIDSHYPNACVPGFVTEILLDPSLALKTPFDQMEMIDVTDRLSKTQPLPTGTKVWMPTMELLQSYSHEN